MIKQVTKGISVLICTYNGASRLPETLRHLAQQTFTQAINWEIILVDNASTDNTSTIAKQIWDGLASPYDLSILTESKPGKSHALDTAVLKAKYEYFIICDDDNWLDTNYVETAFNILESDSSIGAVCGRSTAVNDENSFPEWFNSVAYQYAVGKLADKTEDVTKKYCYLWGAGLASRTNLYKSLYEGFPSLLVGREGSKLSAGEDTEYCQRLILKGYKLFFSVELHFHHFIPPGRLTKEYNNKLVQGFIDAEPILNIYYAVIRMKEKCTNRPFKKIALILITPIRYLLASSTKKAELERNKLHFLLPFTNRTNDKISFIRKFINS